MCIYWVFRAAFREGGGGGGICPFEGSSCPPLDFHECDVKVNTTCYIVHVVHVKFFMLYLYTCSLIVKWCNAELCADIAVVFVIQNDSRVVNQEMHGQNFNCYRKIHKCFPKCHTKSLSLPICVYGTW